jgi:GntR family transcriptional regulator/MocR family aminotransferase
VVGAGAEYLYLLLAQLFGSGAVFAVEDPGYPKIRKVYEKHGAACVPVPMDRHGMDPDALAASGATVAHISPTHHYPTGIVTPIGRRQALLRWAEESDRFIIEDDYDSEFRFTGRPIPTLQSIDTGDRVVYMNTFSQTISPSMRVGFMVLPLRLLKRYREELDFYACTVPVMDQLVLTRFLSGGYFEQHISRMRKEYRNRRNAVLSAFQSSSFASRIRITEQGAGLHFLLHLDTAQTDDALRKKAEAAGVRLGFLSDYAGKPDSALPHTLVVNYAGLSPDRLPDAIHLLECVFSEPESDTNPTFVLR